MKTTELKRLVPDRIWVDRSSAVAADALAEEADRAGLIDVGLGVVGSPIGDLTVAVSRRGLARVLFEDEDLDVALDLLAREVGPRILISTRLTQDVRRELDEYFDGSRRRFSLRLDRRLIHGIALQVLSATARVPFGAVTTYGELAGRIGKPKAARAVGNALGSNPIPIVIPCHRVLRAGGELGGYAGGLDRKAELLGLEGFLPRK